MCCISFDSTIYEIDIFIITLLITKMRLKEVINLLVFELKIV